MAAAEVVDVAVVMVPLPAQGHLNQLLHLARLISSRGIPVHYVASATHVRQALERSPGSAASNVHFHSIKMPAFPTPPASSSSNFPSHLLPAFEAAAQHLSSPLSSLLLTISATARRVAVVHDSLMSAAAIGNNLRNVECYCFHSVSAFASLFFQWESRGRPAEPWVLRLALPDITSNGLFPEEFINFVNRQHSLAAAGGGRVVGRIFNTCRAIEGEFVDLHKLDPRWKDQKVFALGPFNALLPTDYQSDSPARHECLLWLDKQPPKSVVYVSFGTTASLTSEQINELALGLEKSQHRFLWALKDADLGDIYTEDDRENTNTPMADHLQLDYLERIKGRGMVVREWAPQPEILAHVSTAAFISHCGWNSCMESMSNGVPILTWPMHSDQPRNAMLVVHELKVGLTLRDWAKREELVGASVVAGAIMRLMAAVGDGEEVRRNAATVAKAIRAAMEEAGGSSVVELDTFIAHISRDF